MSLCARPCLAPIVRALCSMCRCAAHAAYAARVGARRLQQYIHLEQEQTVGSERQIDLGLSAEPGLPWGWWRRWRQCRRAVGVLYSGSVCTPACASPTVERGGGGSAACPCPTRSGGIPIRPKGLGGCPPIVVPSGCVHSSLRFSPTERPSGDVPAHVLCSRGSGTSSRAEVRGRGRRNTDRKGASALCRAWTGRRGQYSAVRFSSGAVLCTLVVNPDWRDRPPD